MVFTIKKKEGVNSKPSSIISGRELPLQRHYGAEEINTPLRLANNDWSFGKPKGGLWTSSIQPDRDKSEWEEFNQQNKVKKSEEKKVDLEPNPDAQIYRIDSKEDMEKLYKEFPKDLGIVKDIDWTRASQKYDAVNVTSKGLKENRLNTDLPSTDSWDVESTVWFKPAFQKKVHR